MSEFNIQEVKDLYKKVKKEYKALRKQWEVVVDNDGENEVLEDQFNRIEELYFGLSDFLKIKPKEDRFYW